VFPAVLLASLALAQPPAVPNPDWVCRVALGHKSIAVAKAVAAGVSRKDAEAEVSHWYYLSWLGVPADKSPRFKRAARWWVGANLSLAVSEVTFREVEGSGGAVWWFDRREPDWHPDAISKAFAQDTVFRQPAIGEKVAELLRASVGRKADPKTLHVEAVTWAPRLFRDTVESARAGGAYYDLLFSRQRFGQDYREHADPKHAGWYSADGGASWVQKDKLPKADPNFPATLDDWEGFFSRRSKAVGTALGKPVNPVRLAVVAGYNEDPDKGSAVGRAGRAVKVEQGDFGPLMETYDAKESAGGQDLLEFAPQFARGKDPKGTFGETLAALPGGGQAGALWDDKGKRVEQAAGDIARGPQPLLKTCRVVYHPNVRNPGDCVRCHAQSYGIIDPRDMVKDLFDAGADLKFADPADVIRFRGAYGRLKELIPGFQANYKATLERVTAAPGEKPWTGRQLVEAFEELWDWYDSPVTKEQAAAELGVPVPVLERLCARSVTARAKALLKGIAVPRPTWDADVRPALLDVLVGEYPKEVHR